MPKIHILSDDTVNKIAAGEVVERPVAVVKELVENAIDADAAAITIEIKDGGISFIRITDNGYGIAKEDILLAFAAHATSKIAAVEDLLYVSSLGFRGEALASIAAVTKLEMLTKEPGALTGCRFVVDGGKEGKIEDVGCPEGTTFLVRDLFYNTPARRKFLKTAMTEGGYIQEYIERMAVSHPAVAFKFINNNQLKIHTSGNGNIKDAIYHIYGRDIASALLPAAASGETVNITGFIGKPVVSRGNRNHMNYFINGRYIKSKIIQKAIEEAYKPYNMQHRYPFTALMFDMESSLLDVNVHPTKMEVRFRNEKEIYHLVYEAVSRALSHREYVVPVTLDEKAVLGDNAAPYRVSPPPKTDTVPPPAAHKMPVVPQDDILSRDTDNTPAAAHETKEPKASQRGPEPFEKKRMQNMPLKEEKPLQLDMFESELLTKKAEDTYQIIGQLFATYWVVQYENDMYIIDQHAAHEKVLYENFMEAFRKKEVTQQMQNPPIILSLSPREEEIITEYREEFENMGFVIEPFGGKEYAVSAIPAHLPSIGRQELLMEMLGSLAEAPVAQKELLYDKIASMSCKAAVKGNMRLSAIEAKDLIHQLMKLENPYHCPHGRPTIIRMSKQEIEKKFKRIL